MIIKTLIQKVLLASLIAHLMLASTVCSAALPTESSVFALSEAPRSMMLAANTQKPPPSKANRPAAPLKKSAPKTGQALPVRGAFGKAAGKASDYRYQNRIYKIPLIQPRHGAVFFPSKPSQIDQSTIRPSANHFPWRKNPKTKHGLESGSENAQEHFKRHSVEFGAKSVAGYIKLAKSFRNNPPQGTERRNLGGGNVALYNKGSNTLLIHRADGKIKTFYKPAPKQHKTDKGYDGKLYKDPYDYFLRGVRNHDLAKRR